MGRAMCRRYQDLIQRALELGAAEAELVDTCAIVFDPKSYPKCRFGCEWWGSFCTCPTNIEALQEEILEALSSYQKAIFLKATDPKMGRDLTVSIETEAKLLHGFPEALAIVLCARCGDCMYPEPCRVLHVVPPTSGTRGILSEEGPGPRRLNGEAAGDERPLPVWFSVVLLE
ncbi:MAG: DUF2284 domain-containing protein [Thermodesulfobacteriota bacterium]